MRPHQAQVLLREMVQRGIHETVCFVGGTGVGKTQTIINFCKDNKYTLVHFRIGSMQDLVDMLGNTIVKDGRYTEYAMPYWQRAIVESQVPVILFVDEINRARPVNLDAVMQIVGDRRFHTFELPDHVFVIAGMNPVTEDFDVQCFDKAMIERLVFVPWELTIDDMVDYFSERCGAPQEFIDFMTLCCEESEHVEQSTQNPASKSSGQKVSTTGQEMLPNKTAKGRGFRQLLAFWDVIHEYPEFANELVYGCVGSTGLSVWNNQKILQTIPRAEDYFEHGKKPPAANANPLKMMVFLNRVYLYLKKKDFHPELKNKFSELCTSMPSELLMSVVRKVTRDERLRVFFDDENHVLKSAVEELVAARMRNRSLMKDF